MTPLALPCLKQAMADNPSSLHQLQTPDHVPGSPQHYFSASPLLYIGGGGLIAGFVLVLSGHRHFRKAFDVYNQ